jgi:hypothetical protein
MRVEFLIVFSIILTLLSVILFRIADAQINVDTANTRDFVLTEDQVKERLNMYFVYDDSFLERGSQVVCEQRQIISKDELGT